MLEHKLHSGDLLLQKTTKEHHKVILADEEHNQLVVSHESFGYRVVNIKGLEIDYILPNGE